MSAQQNPYDQQTFWISRRQGRYLFVEPQYPHVHPDANDAEFLTINGPYELNALIQFLTQELNRSYPNFSVPVEKIMGDGTRLE